ncbi:isocitrate/isopropylmalate family dehydrogenase [Streptomyces sp. BH106]|uniref:isocitrate/isopropylmalate family dehydrogenase n=1 Tax=Streptomyces sp. BH106 TaxID=3410409 RepID=UPI003CEBCC17
MTSGTEGRDSTPLRVTVVLGDDSSPEVVRPTMDLVSAVAPRIEWVEVDPDGLAAARDAIDASAATLFGAASGRCVPLLRYLRWGKGTYANVRPIRRLPSTATPLREAEGIDFVIVRENLEDLYIGLEGPWSDLAPLGLGDRPELPRQADTEGRFALKAVTPEGVENVARTAFGIARRRARQRGDTAHLVVGTKHNVLPVTDGLFRDVTLRVADDFPDVKVTSYLADDLARRMVVAPQDLDVVLLPNLYGDILSDLAAGLVGGLGVAGSGCYGRHFAYFEPSHGTAPDLTGKGLINPTAQILSAVMMLEHLGLTDAAARLDAAVVRVYRDATSLTADQGGSASTEEFAAAVRAGLN